MYYWYILEWFYDIKMTNKDTVKFLSVKTPNFTIWRKPNYISNIPVIKMKRTLILLTALFIYSSINCQSFPWSDVSQGTIFISAKSQEFNFDDRPQIYRLVSLKEQELMALLERAPMRNQGAKNQKPTLLQLPMPDGTNQEFKVFEAPVMHEDLQRKFPNIKSYIGYGIDDPTAYARFGISSSGFHGMVLSSKHPTGYIDVYEKGDTKHYISYFKDDFHKKERGAFHCGTADDFSVPELDAQLATRGGDCLIRKYRLALACTGEYGQFHGGTKALVLEEYNRSMTRINGIYEREFSVTMELVPNVDTIIFLNPSTDPYTNNFASRMLNENQTTCDNYIGDANYDIGHVFSTADGGIASLRSVCQSGDKARGVTGLPNPTGDPFWVDYVCHEIGHQFGANHTQNNNCARVGSSSMEPGSGSTIMSYAGICVPNVQNQVDDYFHARSHIEIYAFIQGGGNCAQNPQSNNANPTMVNTGADKTLPVSTPFVLEATAEDSGSSALTYLWDQMDSEFALMPPRPTNSEGPAFRSINPSTEPRRYFPNISDLVNNATPTWEVLPSVSREMNFRLVVRDNEPGNGCVNEDDVLLTFADDAGPFLVQQPNGGEEWGITETKAVSWDVANTNMAPVSCANVDIYLSKDGGLTYPILLAENVPNDGTHDITVPSEVTTTARIMVKCTDNYFFDISNNNFEITLPPEPTFVFSVTNPSVSLCGNNPAIYNMQIQTLVGFNESVNFSVDGLPQGANASFSTNPMTPPGALTLTISNLSNVTSGTYNLQLNGTSLSKTITTDLVLQVFNGMPNAASLMAPADGAESIDLGATLNWATQTNAGEYLVEVATTAAFGSTNIASQTTSNNTLSLSGLSPNLVYYWRVTAKNICGDAPVSDIFAFRTVNPQCFSYIGTNIPVTIGNSPGNYTSELMIPDAANIISTQVVVDFEHSYVGDLSASITSPGGKSVDLFNRIGVPADNFGCSGNNIRVVFDDDAGNTEVDLENGCGSFAGNDYTINGIYQPIGQLADFNNDNAQGIWTLNFSDAADDDAGALRAFEIEICKSIVAPPVPQLTVNQTLTVTQNQSENISNTYLQVMSQGNAPADLVYQIRTNTSEGNLLINATPLALGDSFTQADINAGSLSYQHTGSMSMTDKFTFDAFNSAEGWLVNQTFNININFNTLSVNASVIQNILCFGDNDGQISINPSGGTPPFEYRLNNGTYQPSNAFTQLTPGTYTPYVRDANGFESQGTDLVITQPNQIMVSASSTGNVITVMANGGTGTLMYSKDGTNFQASNTFGGNPNGAYTITVRDANNCTATDNVLVSVNTLVVSFTLVNDITCTGDNDGRAQVDVAGGTPPYEYSFNGLPFQASNIVENLPPGSHTANVRDAAGFQMMTNSVVVTDPSPITISTSVNRDNVTVNASGGTGMLRYEIDGLGFQINNMFTGLTNGMHTIVVKDANDCTASDMVQILVNRIQVVLEVENQIKCFGERDGCVLAIASGGKEPYSYSLSGGGFQADNRFCNLPPGSYTIVVRDADGLLQTSNTVTITQPAPLSGNANTNGYDIIINAGGGTPPLNYSLDGTIFQSSNIFRDNTPGLYDQIMVKDANDCTISLSANLNVAALVLTQMVSKEITCGGENSGEIILTPSGGVAPYRFSINGTDFQDSNIFENLRAGDYTFYVKDDGGFTATVMVTLTEPSPVLINGTSYANQSITIDASGGTGPLEYNFGTGAFSPSSTLANITPGATISVMVRDENGCFANASYQVPEVTYDRVEIQSIDCTGAMGARIQIFVNGGVPPLEYSLSGGAFQTQTLFTDVSAGTNSVDIRDAAGFEYTFSLPIIPAYPVGGTVMISGNDITVTASNGQQPFQYSLDGTNFQSSNVFQNVPNGANIITIRDSNGCEGTVNADISGANDLRYRLVFDVSPNPSYGVVNLKISQPTLQDLTVRVFDMAGKVVFETPTRKSGMTLNQSFNLSHLQSGTYLVTISDGQKIGRKRLVLMK